MNNWHYELAWYGAGKDDSQKGSIVLQNITQQDVRRWFYLDQEDEACECYAVAADQRLELMKHIEEEIDLNEYVYYVEGIAD